MEIQRQIVVGLCLSIYVSHGEFLTGQDQTKPGITEPSRDGTSVPWNPDIDTLPLSTLFFSWF